MVRGTAIALIPCFKASPPINFPPLIKKFCKFQRDVASIREFQNYVQFFGWNTLIESQWDAKCDQSRTFEQISNFRPKQNCKKSALIHFSLYPRESQNIIERFYKIFPEFFHFSKKSLFSDQFNFNLTVASQDIHESKSECKIGILRLRIKNAEIEKILSDKGFLSNFLSL